MTNNQQAITTLFTDRDGVINHDSSDYIKNCDEFRFIAGSRRAFKLLKTYHIDAIVITNQSVIGRHMVSPAGLDQIFDKMKAGITEAGGHVKDIFFCPHTPEDDCQCRKPRPGLILQARKTYGMDLAHSAMVGDSAKDIECALNAGVGITILVQTGNGKKAAKALEKKGIFPDYIADHLLDGVRWLLGMSA